MKRALLALVVAGAIVVAVLISGGGSGSFRVDALFPTAKGMVPGQLVKIAGARVGEVQAITLVRTPGHGYEARMELSIADRFRPFHANATCQILPEGLISENFVECDPGSAARPGLARDAAGYPAVPADHTSAAVSLQDVFNIFSVPTDQRLALFFDTLGIGTAGRGTDINAILQRANPSLTQARRALTIVGAQNHELAQAVTQTSEILVQLAKRSTSVREFVDRTAAVSRTTAAHQESLESAVMRLPGTLAAVRRGLTSLDRVALGSPPLLTDLRDAAPGLMALTDRVSPFAATAIPALRSVAHAAARGRAAIPVLRPVVADLNGFARQAAPVSKLLDELLVSTRDRGGIEGLLRVLYALGTFSGPYDSLGHMVGLFFTLFPECISTNEENAPAPGCSHAYTAPEHGQAPVNDPSADPGPNSADVTQSSVSSAPATSSSGFPISQAQARSLLSYLLK